MASDNNLSNEQQIYNTLDQSDKTIIGISDDVNDLKTEVIGLIMFVTEQLYLLKQSICNPKTPE